MAGFFNRRNPYARLHEDYTDADAAAEESDSPIRQQSERISLSLNQIVSTHNFIETQKDYFAHCTTVSASDCDHLLRALSSLEKFVQEAIDDTKILRRVL